MAHVIHDAGKLAHSHVLNKCMAERRWFVAPTVIANRWLYFIKQGALDCSVAGDAFMTEIKLIGVYRVDVPGSEWEAAIACHGSREAAAEELETLALVELEIRGAEQGFDTSSLKQPHTECIPYNESFFNIDTLEAIPTELYAVPELPDFRIAFHLHHYNPTEVLETPVGTLRVGQLTDPPPHLRDKPYVYWD
ncbi:MAG: hypothetical protein QM808_09165 [Steroidobacteraceae bacterium]